MIRLQQLKIPPTLLQKTLSVSLLPFITLYTTGSSKVTTSTNTEPLQHTQRSRLLHSTATMAAASASTLESKLRFVDIGINFTDPMFHGKYRGKQYHDDDFDMVVQRAEAAGVDKFMITAGTLQEAKHALELANSNSKFYSTVGVHPTRANEFVKSGNADAHTAKLLEIAEEGVKTGKVVAIGKYAHTHTHTHTQTCHEYVLSHHHHNACIRLYLRSTLLYSTLLYSTLQQVNVDWIMTASNSARRMSNLHTLSIISS
jgi:co-chaperonin GroES (HSP10)